MAGAMTLAFSGGFASNLDEDIKFARELGNMAELPKIVSENLYKPDAKLPDFGKVVWIDSFKELEEKNITPNIFYQNAFKINDILPGLTIKEVVNRIPDYTKKILENYGAHKKDEKSTIDYYQEYELFSNNTIQDLKERIKNLKELGLDEQATFESISADTQFITELKKIQADWKQIISDSFTKPENEFKEVNRPFDINSMFRDFVAQYSNNYPTQNNPYEEERMGPPRNLGNTSRMIEEETLEQQYDTFAAKLGQFQNSDKSTGWNQKLFEEAVRIMPKSKEEAMNLNNWEEVTREFLNVSHLYGGGNATDAHRRIRDFMLIIYKFTPSEYKNISDNETSN